MLTADCSRHRFLGDRSEEDPPVPIPNTEVKLLSPDGTAQATVWESRKLPGFNYKSPTAPAVGLLPGDWPFESGYRGRLPQSKQRRCRASPSQVGVSMRSRLRAP